MAINPEQIDVTDLSKLDTASLALNNFFAHSLPNGLLQKNTISELATFLSPFISQLGASGFVPVSGSVLPSPENDNLFTLVSKGVKTQTTGGDINATGDLNILGWNGATWTLISPITIDLSGYATSVDLDAVKDKTDNIDVDSNGDYFAVIDDNGNKGFSVKEDGISAVRLLDANNNTISLEVIPYQDGSFGLIDENGNIAQIIPKNGIQDIESYLQHIFGKPYEWQIIENYGQSNSFGVQAQPVITIVQKYNSLMPLDGPRKTSDTITSLTYLKESVSGVNRNVGETSLSAWSESAIEQIDKKSLIPYLSTGFSFIGIATGEGSTTATQLSKGSAYYNYGIKNVRDIKRIADNNSKSLSVVALSWVQGEGDVDADTTLANYFNTARQIFVDKNNDYKNITGQKNNIFFLGYQIAWGDAKDQVALAHLRMHNEIQAFCIFAPAYIAKYVSPENIHMTSASQRKMGGYQGIAHYNYLVSGKKQLLQPNYHEIYNEGKSIDIYFDVPHFPLKFDVEQVPMAPENKYGFRVYNSSNSYVDIDSVILGYNKVTINLPSNVSGGKVTYATYPNFGGGSFNNGDGSVFLANRGNLRDSQGDIEKFDGQRMDNWCVRFSINL